jgi:hypothetical protein
MTQRYEGDVCAEIWKGQAQATLHRRSGLILGRLNQLTLGGPKINISPNFWTGPGQHFVPHLCVGDFCGY